MTEQDYEDYMIDQAKEQAKEDRHNARHTITLTGTEANIIMNNLRSVMFPGCPLDKEVEELRRKFGDLYFTGKWTEVPKDA